MVILTPLNIEKKQLQQNYQQKIQNTNNLSQIIKIIKKKT